MCLPFFLFMGKYIRLANGTIVKPPYQLERPFSNFQFLGGELFAQQYGNSEPLHRILSQIRQHAGRTMVVEVIDDLSTDIQEENEDYAKRFSVDVTDISSQVLRLSFFRKSFTDISELSEITDTDFLGYAIIKLDLEKGQIFYVRIYESVIKLSRQQNNYIHGTSQWKCKVGNKIFSINGYLYAQQNSRTNCCAHAAIRTVAARFHSDGDMTYREMNDIVGVDHKSRIIDSQSGEGLGYQDIMKILEHAGARCMSANYLAEPPPPAPYYKYVYGAIESGYPAIIIFETKPRPGETEGGCHAVPIFGHTFNQDAWVPNVESSYFEAGDRKYIPSESWVSMFVGHDDNVGSNFCIPRTYMDQARLCVNVPTTGANAPRCEQQGESVCCVFWCLPPDVKVDPIDAEVIGADYLLPMLIEQSPVLGDFWGGLLEFYHKNKRIVFRPVLIDTDQYIDHIKKLSNWNGDRISDIYAETLPKHFASTKCWMIEISVPHLFPTNKRKIGEILINATENVDPKQQGDLFVVARVPGWFAFFKEMREGKIIYNFEPSGCDGHVQLFGCEDKA